MCNVSPFHTRYDTHTAMLKRQGFQGEQNIRSEHVVRRQKTFPLRPARQPHMAGPRTSGAIPRLARRAEMAHAEPGIAARTIAGTETGTR